ncbi:hypothetical protein [Lapillicoccus jejuensis]|uniref:Uncharacterized protein n=1 Tax=Lapillicoccus jejuensis TaxID=402171 RepID=A0A542DWF2_9MICO|nr:hypothetical protein [Lapillicoccus jejuensis]TQJ07244.1 hypothetical protein FB458_0302 [Lapillicoccus jejuensis]
MPRTAPGSSPTGRPVGVRRPARLLATGLATAALTLVSTTAWAWWSGPGAGTVPRSVGGAPVLVVGSASLSGVLTPGVARDLTVTVTNPGPAPVTVTGLGGSVTGTSAGGCPTSSVTVAGATPAGLVVAAGASTTRTLTGVVTLLSSAPDACQGVGVTLSVSVTGRL